MAYTKSTKIANDMLAAAFANFAAGDVVDIKTGAPPGPNAAPTGTIVAQIVLPSTPTTTSAGSTNMIGVWQDLAANADGTAGHFVIRQASDDGSVNDGTKPRILGTVSAPGGGGDMIVSPSNVFATAQRFDISSWSFTV